MPRFPFPSPRNTQPTDTQRLSDEADHGARELAREESPPPPPPPSPPPPPPPPTPSQSVQPLRPMQPMRYPLPPRPPTPEPPPPHQRPQSLPPWPVWPPSTHQPTQPAPPPSSTQPAQGFLFDVTDQVREAEQSRPRQPGPRRNLVRLLAPSQPGQPPAYTVREVTDEQYAQLMRLEAEIQERLRIEQHLAAMGRRERDDAEEMRRIGPQMFRVRRDFARCMTNEVAFAERNQDNFDDKQELREITYGKCVDVDLSYEGMIHLANGCWGAQEVPPGRDVRYVNGFGFSGELNQQGGLEGYLSTAERERRERQQQQGQQQQGQTVLLVPTRQRRSRWS